MIWMEEDKRATTNMQNGLAFCRLFSFVLSEPFELEPHNSKRVQRIFQ